MFVLFLASVLIPLSNVYARYNTTVLPVIPYSKLMLGTELGF